MTRKFKSTGTRSYHAYAKLMRTVLEGDVTTAELAAKHDLGANPVFQIMRRLHRQKVVHVARWEREARRGCGFREVWSFGAGRDAPRPATCAGTPSLRKEPARLRFRPQVFVFGLLMVALADGNTLDALVDMVGVERKQLRDIVSYMRSIKLVHIQDWHRNPTGCPSPVYKLGDKRNEPRPKPLGREARDIEYATECTRRSEWISLLHMTAAPLPAAAHA